MTQGGARQIHTETGLELGGECGRSNDGSPLPAGVLVPFESGREMGDVARGLGDSDTGGRPGGLPDGPMLCDCERGLWAWKDAARGDEYVPL